MNHKKISYKKGDFKMEKAGKVIVKVAGVVVKVLGSGVVSMVKTILETVNKHHKRDGCSFCV